MTYKNNIFIACEYVFQLFAGYKSFQFNIFKEFMH